MFVPLEVGRLPERVLQQRFGDFGLLGWHRVHMVDVTDGNARYNLHEHSLLCWRGAWFLKLKETTVLVVVHLIVALHDVLVSIDFICPLYCHTVDDIDVGTDHLDIDLFTITILLGSALEQVHASRYEIVVWIKRLQFTCIFLICRHWLFLQQCCIF